MEKEDQIIKELVKEGFLKKAPEDFTENVMMVVAKTEENKKQAFDPSILSYISIVGATIGLSAGVIYYINPTFIRETFGFFIDFLKQVYFSFTNLFDGQINWSVGFELNTIVVGVILIMAALIAFDSFLVRSSKYFNVFV